jgi:hypothetical protein
MPSPLTLSLAPLKSRLLVGEGATLRLEVGCRYPVNLTFPELSSHSIVVVTALEADEARELTSAEHCLLHRVSGRRFAAYEGFPLRITPDRGYWGYLRLLDYERPLRPGRYRIALRYRLGGDEAAEASSNEVELEVASAEHAYGRYRWFSETGGRDTPEAVWALEEGEEVRYLYQVGRRGDPSVLTASTVVEVAGAVDSTPTLGHLDGSGSFYPERRLFWLAGRCLQVAEVSQEGLGAQVVELEHGLDAEPAPRLVEPPLQRPSGGTIAVVSGFDLVKPTLSVLEVGDDGDTDRRLLKLGGAPVHTAVLWSQDEERSSGVCFWTRAPRGADGWRLYQTDLETTHERLRWEPGREVIGVALDQFGGAGWLYLLTRQEPGVGEQDVVLRVWALDAADEAAEPEYRLGFTVPAPCEVLQVEPLPNGAGLAVLVSCGQGVLALAPGVRFDLSELESIPTLVASGRRLFAVHADSGEPLTSIEIAPGDGGFEEVPEGQSRDAHDDDDDDDDDDDEGGDA